MFQYSSALRLEWLWTVEVRHQFHLQSLAAVPNFHGAETREGHTRATRSGADELDREDRAAGGAEQLGQHGILDLRPETARGRQRGRGHGGVGGQGRHTE